MGGGVWNNPNTKTHHTWFSLPPLHSLLLSSPHLARVERVPQHLGHAPAEEEGDQVELGMDGAHLEQGHRPRGAGDGGHVDDAPQRPDAGGDLDD